MFEIRVCIIKALENGCYFLPLLSENTWQNKPQEGRVDFGSWFEGAAHHGRGGAEAGVCGSSYIASEVRKRGGGSAGAQLTPILLSLGSQPMARCCPPSEWVVPPQLISGKAPTDMPRVSPRWF